MPAVDPRNLQKCQVSICVSVQRLYWGWQKPFWKLTPLAIKKRLAAAVGCRGLSLLLRMLHYKTPLSKKIVLFKYFARICLPNKLLRVSCFHSKTKYRSPNTAKRSALKDLNLGPFDYWSNVLSNRHIQGVY